MTSSHLLSQFCEWMSTAGMRQWAGPVLDLLLQHVAQVQLCSKLLELLDTREEWRAVKRKSRKHDSLKSHVQVHDRSNGDPPPPQYRHVHCSTSAGYRYGPGWADTD